MSDPESLPAPGSVWVNFAGTAFSVVATAEPLADLMGEPVVVFRDEDGRVWFVPIELWRKMMTPVGGAH